MNCPDCDHEAAPLEFDLMCCTNEGCGITWYPDADEQARLRRRIATLEARLARVLDLLEGGFPREDHERRSIFAADYGRAWSRRALARLAKAAR